MQNRITLIFTSDDPNNPGKTLYDSRSFTLLGDPQAISDITDQLQISSLRRAAAFLEDLECDYGTLEEIDGGGDEDFLWGFQTTGETEPKDFDTITDAVRQFFEDTFSVTLSPTTQTISNIEPH